MGIEYKLSDSEPAEKTRNLMLELAPRNQCKNYAIKNGRRAILITQEEFDAHFKRADFSEGPFTDSFGDSHGEPYNPNRQAFGRLDSGLVVYCELSENFKKKSEELLRLSEEKS